MIEVFPISSDQCKVRRPSPLTKTVNEMVLPVSDVRVRSYLEGRDNRLVQHQFPELDAGQREFLMTGYTPEDWAQMFPPETL